MTSQSQNWVASFLFENLLYKNLLLSYFSFDLDGVSRRLHGFCKGFHLRFDCFQCCHGRIQRGAGGPDPPPPP